MLFFSWVVHGGLWLVKAQWNPKTMIAKVKTHSAFGQKGPPVIWKTLPVWNHGDKVGDDITNVGSFMGCLRWTRSWIENCGVFLVGNRHVIPRDVGNSTTQPPKSNALALRIIPLSSFIELRSTSTRKRFLLLGLAPILSSVPEKSAERIKRVPIILYSASSSWERKIENTSSSRTKWSPSNLHQLHIPHALGNVLLRNTPCMNQAWSDSHV